MSTPPAIIIGERPCGCRAALTGPGTGEIVYCALHERAPNMRELLMRAIEAIDLVTPFPTWWVNEARAIIAVTAAADRDDH